KPGTASDAKAQRVLGVEDQGFGKIADGLIVIALSKPGYASAVKGMLGDLWVEVDGPVKVLGSIVVLLFRKQNMPTVAKGEGVIGVYAYGGLIVMDGLVIFLLLMPD